jgi:hypothetical protein
MVLNGTLAADLFSAQQLSQSKRLTIYDRAKI